MLGSIPNRSTKNAPAGMDRQGAQCPSRRDERKLPASPAEPIGVAGLMDAEDAED